MNLYLIKYSKDGIKGYCYQIPADNEFDACVRLGQVYGDDKIYRNDLVIEVESVTLSARG